MPHVTPEIASEVALPKPKTKHKGKRKGVAWCSPVGTISLRTKATIQHGHHIRIVKRFYIKQNNYTWIRLSVYNWLQAFGADSIPPGYHVAYVDLPPDTPLDSDYRLDDVANLKLVNSLISANLERSEKLQKKRSKRHRLAISEANQQRWDVWNSSRIRESPRVWYPLDTIRKIVWMRPRATRKAAIEETRKAGRPCDIAVKGSELREYITADWERRSLNEVGDVSVGD